MITLWPFIWTPGAPAGGGVKVWTGSAWAVKPVKYWTGSAWVEKPVKYWNGSAWITTGAASGISRVGLAALAALNSATDLVLDIPAGSNGETLVAVMASRDGDRVPTTPSGWTKIGTGAGWSTGEPAISVFRRVRDGSEGSTLTINTPGGSGRLIGFIGAYSGVSTDGAESTVAAFGATTRVTPTLTATADSCILHIWTLGATSPTVTLPNGGDLMRSGLTPDGEWFLGAENQFAVGAGTTTGRTASSTVSGNWNAMQIELLKA